MTKKLSRPLTTLKLAKPIQHLALEQGGTISAKFPEKKKISVLLLPGCMIYIESSLLKDLANVKSLTELQKNTEIGLTFSLIQKKKPSNLGRKKLGIK